MACLLFGLNPPPKKKGYKEGEERSAFVAMYNPYEHQESLALREIVPKAAYEQALLQSSGPVSDVAHSSTAAEGDKVQLGAEAPVAAPGSSSRLVLHKLFPPVDAGIVDGTAMLSVPVSAPPSKMDVINLQDQLEKKCKASNARAIGVCPVRERLYDECLDELIRQSSIDCPERGVLLALLRDEMNETNRTYELLFEAACRFGVRKVIERDLKRTMESQLHELVRDTNILENRVHEMRAKLEGIEKRVQERRTAEDKKHQEEVTFLKKGNTQLANEIKRLTN